MEKLKQAGLYMSALFAIRGKMVDRYNQCLGALGIAPTTLTSFYIDAIGWSPEIALEKEKIHYLNHGGANPYGIIISPTQKGMPVYSPFHSFDRELVNLFMATNEESIKDITTDAAIIIDLNQSIDAFYEPSDLIDYKTITVGYKILGELDREQIRQNTLVQKMYMKHNSLDENLHNKILASASRFGDLRGRSLQLREVDYQTTSFYTKAFGGVFVLRSDANGHLLIFESQEEMNKYQHTYWAEHISSPNLLTELTNRGYLHFDPGTLNIERVQRIAQHYYAQSVKNAAHSLTDILGDKILYLKYLNELSQEDKVKVMGPQKYLEKLAAGQTPDINQYIASETFKALQSPAKKSLEPLMWQLICHMQPVDPYYTYYYDKELFYRQFINYDEAYQDWVVKIIQEENNKLNN